MTCLKYNSQNINDIISISQNTKVELLCYNFQLFWKENLKLARHCVENLKLLIIWSVYFHFRFIIENRFNFPNKRNWFLFYAFLAVASKLKKQILCQLHCYIYWLNILFSRKLRFLELWIMICFFVKYDIILLLFSLKYYIYLMSFHVTLCSAALF